MPNPFDPNSYGRPSFEDLMVGALTESAARAKMDADQRTVAEQLRRQAGRPIETRSWPARYDEMRRSGYADTPIDPAVFEGGSPYDAADLIGWRNDAIDTRVADDLSVAVQQQLEAQQAPGRIYDLPPPARRNPVARPVVEPGMPLEGGDRDYAQAEQRERGVPWTLIPLVGDLEDQRAMERRSQGQPGWQPLDFEGLDHFAAAAAIADQLKARRIKQMGDWAPDYLQNLPVY